ncbi:DUF4231 domain-containing protein [Aurantivibrio infirmus]
MLKKYIKKQVVNATRITLPSCEISYEKWGGKQAAKSGDWIVQSTDDSYTVEAESFKNTYQHIKANQYKKVTPVWAEVADVNGKISTKEGTSDYSPGDYLVYNNENKTDGYAVKKQDFESNYQTMESETMELQAEDYLKQRVEDQINWYDKKSSLNQHRFKRLQMLSIIFASCIPLLTAISFKEYDTVFRFIIALLGTLIAIISGFLSLNKFQENWVEYRACAESLRREKYLYLTRSGPYAEDEENLFALLVERCEGIMTNEQLGWMKTAYPQSPAKKKPEMPK